MRGFTPVQYSGFVPLFAASPLLYEEELLDEEQSRSPTNLSSVFWRFMFV